MESHILHAIIRNILQTNYMQSPSKRPMRTSQEGGGQSNSIILSYSTSDFPMKFA